MRRPFVRWRWHVKTALASAISRAHGRGLASPLVRGAGCPLVLGYHRVVEDFGASARTEMPSMLVSARMFERHLDWIGRRFRFVSLDDVGAQIASGRPFDHPVAAVTFDDGYRDVYEHAFPILKRKGIPAAVFVVTDLVGKPFWQVHDKLYHLFAKAFAAWNDPRRELDALFGALGLPTSAIRRRAIGNPMMAVSSVLPALNMADVRRVMDGLETAVGNGFYDIPRTIDWNELLEMQRAGVIIGSHTRSHVSLPMEASEDVAEELEGSKRTLEERLGRSVPHFAYPGGQFTPAVVNAVDRAGYRFAYTACSHGDRQHGALTIERLLLWQGSSVDADGRFSPEILDCQVHGLWPPARRCDRRHAGGLTPELQIVAGRTIGLAATFAIGVVLARMFEPAGFGIYKQFFLVYATLYGVLQLGMAESLYYFVPRTEAHTGRYVANAMVTLLIVGALSTAGLVAARPLIAGWLTPELAAGVVPLGVFLTCMLASTVLEIVLISRRRHAAAAVTYAVSDIARALLFIAPVLLFTSLRAVFIGAAAFAAMRLAATVLALWRAFGRELRVDLVRWREQLAYALPFAAAVGIEVVLINYHQYVVAARFDAATFAIYAIGCMQIPLYDLIVSSTVNVLMVRMAGTPRGAAALPLWHDAVSRLAFLIFPLVAVLVIGARPLIVGLFTATYAASVPVFILWTLTMVPAVMAVDAVLRVYAQTRFLLVMNLVRLVCVAGLIGAFLSSFGLSGAVFITLVALTVTKTLGLVRIATLLEVGVLQLLPWRRLAGITAIALVSIAPAAAVQRILPWPPLAVFLASSAVYGAAYALLSYGLTFLTPAPAPAQERHSTCAA